MKQLKFCMGGGVLALLLLFSLAFFSCDSDGSSDSVDLTYNPSGDTTTLTVRKNYLSACDISPYHNENDEKYEANVDIDFVAFGNKRALKKGDRYTIEFSAKTDSELSDYWVSIVKKPNGYEWKQFSDGVYKEKTFAKGSTISLKETIVLNENAGGADVGDAVIWISFKHPKNYTPSEGDIVELTDMKYSITSTNVSIEQTESILGKTYKLSDNGSDVRFRFDYITGVSFIGESKIDHYEYCASVTGSSDYDRCYAAPNKSEKSGEVELYKSGTENDGTISLTHYASGTYEVSSDFKTITCTMKDAGLQSPLTLTLVSQ